MEAENLQETCEADRKFTSEGIGISLKLVTTPDSVIAKNNRLSLMMDIHQRRTISKEDNEMATKKESGKCESCGTEARAAGRNYGMLMCSSCASVYAHINNRPEVVKGAISRLGKDDLFGSGSDHAAIELIEAETLRRGQLLERIAKAKADREARNRKPV